MEREWELKAACRDEDPDIFFSGKTRGQAQVICGGCPVREECLAAALVREAGVAKVYREGIVAGLTGAQRWNLARQQDQRRRNEVAQCGTRSGYLRHRSRGEEACGPCKAANARGESQYRRTGSTRVPV